MPYQIISMICPVAGKFTIHGKSIAHCGRPSRHPTATSFIVWGIRRPAIECKRRKVGHKQADHQNQAGLYTILFGSRIGNNMKRIKLKKSLRSFYLSIIAFHSGRFNFSIKLFLIIFVKFITSNNITFSFIPLAGKKLQRKYK